jgi:hypothetical protein
LKALLTDVWIVENFASDRGLQEGGRERPHTGFKFGFDVLRAVRMRAP